MIGTRCCTGCVSFPSLQKKYIDIYSFTNLEIFYEDDLEVVIEFHVYFDILNNEFACFASDSETFNTLCAILCKLASSGINLFCVIAFSS